MKCRNEFCLHNKSVDPSMISEWNNTDCSYYEIDPWDIDNPTGFKIEECEARKRFERMF